MNRTIKPSLHKIKVVKSSGISVKLSIKDYILAELAKHSSPVQSKIIAKDLNMLHQAVYIALEVLYREGRITTNGMTGQYKKWMLVQASATQEKDK